MADISIVQAHSLNRVQARAAAGKVADKLARDYDLACTWEGDVLRFERSGVQGALTLQEQAAQMSITLGFPLSAFAAAVEAKVADNMRKVFGASGV
jgi:putative polyhydroxyalkanoate system protein